MANNSIDKSSLLSSYHNQHHLEKATCNGINVCFSHDQDSIQKELLKQIDLVGQSSISFPLSINTILIFILITNQPAHNSQVDRQADVACMSMIMRMKNGNGFEIEY